MGPYNTTPIVYEGRYYTALDRGMLTCHDAQTGEIIFDRTRFPSGASFTACPWAYNGKVFCVSEQGDTYVFEAGNEFKLLHVNPLDDFVMATPAIVDDRLLLRTQNRLYCIRKGS